MKKTKESLKLQKVCEKVNKKENTLEVFIIVLMPILKMLNIFCKNKEK